MTKFPTEATFKRIRLAFHLISEAGNLINSCELITSISEKLEDTYMQVYYSLSQVKQYGLINMSELPYTKAQIYSLSDLGVMFFAEAEENGYAKMWKEYFKLGGKK